MRSLVYRTFWFGAFGLWSGPLEVRDSGAGLWVWSGGCLVYRSFLVSGANWSLELVYGAVGIWMFAVAQAP